MLLRCNAFGLSSQRAGTSPAGRERRCHIELRAARVRRFRAGRRASATSKARLASSDLILKNEHRELAFQGNGHTRPSPVDSSRFGRADEVCWMPSGDPRPHLARGAFAVRLAQVLGRLLRSLIALTQGDLLLFGPA